MKSRAINKKIEKVKCEGQSLLVANKKIPGFAVGEQENVKTKLSVYYLESLNFKDPLNG